MDLELNSGQVMMVNADFIGLVEDGNPKKVYMIPMGIIRNSSYFILIL